MSIYAGLDVSDKTTHICVVDVDGKVLRRDVVESDPDFLAKWLNKHCSDLTRVVLETGTLSTFLYHGLVERGVAIECICARHAKGVLSARVNKSDVHDAEGLAQLARTGWYKRVHMKASATHIDRAALRIRAQLITARTSMANQLRGLLKLFGLRMGTARTPGRRTERLTAFYAQRPDLKALFAPLIASMETIEEQLRAYNRLLTDRAKADEVCARLMSVHAIEAIDDGGRDTLPAGIWNSVMSVSHFSLGGFAWKSRLIRFSGAGLISPKYEPKRRRLGLATTKHSSFINRCTTFSEIVTLCLASDACTLQ